MIITTNHEIKITIFLYYFDLLMRLIFFIKKMKLIL